MSTGSTAGALPVQLKRCDTAGRRKSFRLLQAAWLLPATASFFVYGFTRTFDDQIGFEAAQFLRAGTALTFVTLLIAFVAWYCWTLRREANAPKSSRSCRSIGPLAIASALSVFVGGAVAEAVALNDEFRFHQEVVETLRRDSQTRLVCRARAWPSGGTLIYTSEQGLHSY